MFVSPEHHHGIPRKLYDKNNYLFPLKINLIGSLIADEMKVLIFCFIMFLWQYIKVGDVIATPLDTVCDSPVFDTVLMFQLLKIKTCFFVLL